MRNSTQPKTTRDAILDATDRLLQKYGYKKMTIDDLAAEVGIGKGTVYLHFKSKEEIALSHIDRIIERLKHRLVEIRDSSAPFEERLTKMLVERVLFRIDSVQHYSQSLNDMLSQIRANLLDRRRRYFEEEAQIIARLLEAGAASGEVEVDDPLETARSVIDATSALLPYGLSVYELGDKQEIERKVRRIAGLLLRGLVKR